MQEGNQKKLFPLKSSFHGEMAIKVCTLHGRLKANTKFMFESLNTCYCLRWRVSRAEQQLIRETSLNPSVGNNRDDDGASKANEWLIDSRNSA